MDLSANLPALADWMMYGGGAAALAGLVLSAFTSRAGGSAGMAQPLAILGIVVFVAGLALAIHQGMLGIAALP